VLRLCSLVNALEVALPRGRATMSTDRLHARQRRSWQLLVLASLAVACSGDTCVLYPCPQSEAAEISVTAPNAPTGIAGLSMAITGAVVGSGPCNQGTSGVSVCYIDGGPGTYSVALSAPGYQTATVRFTATGTAAGCNTCGHVDRQLLSVVLQPTA
jgi:hypothetical protein